jgi:hypothetical protein
MKKASAKRSKDDLRREYDLSQLKSGVRGKYYREATAGTNLVLIEPELANVFPDTESVNRALRLLERHCRVSHSKEKSSKEISKRPADRQKFTGQPHLD